MSAKTAWPYGDVTVSPIGSDRKLYRASFDSVEAIRQVKPSSRNEQAFQHTQRDNRGAHWYGVEGDAPAVHRVIAEGWPDGVARLAEMTDTLPPSPAVSIKRRRARGDHGDELDIHRVYRGQVDTAWMRRQRKATHAPRHVDLVAITSANCSTMAEAMFWRGAALCRLADLLDEAGYAVRIRGAELASGVNSRGTSDQVSDWIVKDYSEPLSLTNVAVSVCLAGFFRCIGFATIASIPEEVSAGFGSAVHYGPLVDSFFADSIIVPKTVRDSASASEWVAEQVAMIDSGGLPLAA